jgi:malonyl-CoA/methylmalonyl-CoA synthetase
MVPAGVWDRTHHVPPHRGQNMLPNTPMLTQILHHALKPGRMAIKDLNTGAEKTYAHLLADVLYLRNHIETKLTPSAKKALDDGEEVYIGVLAAGGYEYVVAFLAILALKAAIVPMSKSL